RADNPPLTPSAGWRETQGDFIDTTIAQARFHDLVVMSRASVGESLAVLGGVLIGSGRPLLLAPSRAPETVGSTIAIAWKDSPEAARAVTTAMPFLSRAGRVLILTANEETERSPSEIESAEKVVTQLRWNGIGAEARSVIP